MVRCRRLGAVSRRDNALAALVATLWGLNFLAIDLGMGEVPPLVFLALRFVAVVLPAVFLVPRPAVSWRVLGAVGLFMSVGQFGFLYVAMDVGLPPGIAALVLQAQVVFTIVIAAGVLLGVLGLAVVAQGRGGDVPLLGMGLCLMGALSWGIGNVVSRAAKVPGGLSLTVWSGLVVPVPVLALALVVDGPSAVVEGLAAVDGAAVLATLYTAGVASLLGYGIFNTLLARNPSAAVVPWVLLAPVVAMTAAWLLLGDLPTVGEAGGGLLLVLGVLLALRAPRGRSASAPALGVGRAVAGQGRERGADAPRGEVGAELVDLVEGAEAR